MLLEGHLAVLERVCLLLDDPALRWAVSGSAALVLQGVEVRCNDLDLVTDAGAAAVVERLLAGTVLEPVCQRTRGAIRGQLGRLLLDGIEVELLGGVQNLAAGGSWSDPPSLDQEIARVPVGSYSCPVVSLAALRGAYQAMGRHEKVRLIDETLAAGKR